MKWFLARQNKNSSKRLGEGEGEALTNFPNVWYQQKLIPVFLSLLRKLKSSRVTYVSIADAEIPPSTQECLDALWILVDAMDANGEMSVAEIDAAYSKCDRFTWWATIKYFFKHSRNVFMSMEILEHACRRVFVFAIRRGK